MRKYWSVSGILLSLFLTGCASDPYSIRLTPPEGTQSPPQTSADLKAKPSQDSLKSQLGMARAPADLGFAERSFNPCLYGISGLSCDNQQFLSVVHFQMLCRDSEGTINTFPPELKPIIAPNLSWNVGGQTGVTHTDDHGFGQFTVLSSSSIQGKRLILKRGSQFVGTEVSEITRIVLPRDWCGRRNAANP